MPVSHAFDAANPDFSSVQAASASKFLVVKYSGLAKY
jgi:hypothetical protein